MVEAAEACCCLLFALVVVGLLNRFGLTHDSYYNTTKVFVGLATEATE